MQPPIQVPVPAALPQNDTYSQAVRLGDVIYVSGQLGIMPDTSLPESFRDEVRQASKTSGWF